MARIANVDVPDGKRVEVALRSIYGIGPTRARVITERAGIAGNPRVHELNDEQLGRIRELVDREYVVEGDLRREVNDNIRRLIDIGTYRGLRHRRSLPVHGQRTKTNAKTRRGGSRRAIAGKKKVRK